MGLLGVGAAAAPGADADGRPEGALGVAQGVISGGPFRIIWGCISLVPPCYLMESGPEKPISVSPPPAILNRRGDMA